MTDLIRPLTPDLRVRVIYGFTGPFRFLSNFYPCEITYMDLKFHTVEAAYQAAKFLSPHKRRVISHMKPPLAKMYAKRTDGKYTPAEWAERKDAVMMGLLQQKFASPNLHLMQKLRATGNAKLVEGNNWGDTYWGQVNGEGLNKLGEMLMQVRLELPQLGRNR